ncbi:E3 ubiquitin-protein ligase SPL2-like [Papaver somniferum]|uniref:E3 ubiquitin-protein ligase SPL2-like n=1 Tax=Papaver somniferum TaxID=3469 RepID=UPI000E70000D|nr:E3 ubiquitin-protein ligase SPL2-like [Papaver somniferum]XP_026440347.1 E3 ubiquitin-protein ligase SPL2-like [Papaver somniferum]XP_026440348.1 E3 ubiquitin-protein ligase SPL2-like [Papaver somniferum]XP_026440349.1 E3 ubiquitin-protein ligase SPL2-like [Papaver somniferum]
MDVAAAGVVSAYCAVKTWRKYYFTSNALNKIREAPNANVSDLRQLLDKEVETSNRTGGKLVVVKGIVVEAQRSVGGGWGNIRPTALVSSEAAGGTAVLIEKTQMVLSQKVPFVLLDIGRSLSSDYLFVNMEGSKHPLHISTVLHELQPVQASPSTFLQAVLRHQYPVGLLNEEKVLSIGKQISAVGVCSFGVPQIKSSQDLPYFLTELTKDQLVEDLAYSKNCLFWCGLALGSLSIGLLGYATMRGWRRWKEMKKQWRAKASNVAEAIAAVAVTAAAGLAIAVIATEFLDDEIGGEVPDRELCAICLSRRRGTGTLYGPCGHILSCKICAPSADEQQSSPSHTLALHELDGMTVGDVEEETSISN